VFQSAQTNWASDVECWQAKVDAINAFKAAYTIEEMGPDTGFVCDSHLSYLQALLAEGGWTREAQLAHAAGIRAAATAHPTAEWVSTQKYRVNLADTLLTAGAHEEALAEAQAGLDAGALVSWLPARAYLVVGRAQKALGNISESIAAFKAGAATQPERFAGNCALEGILTMGEANRSQDEIDALALQLALSGDISQVKRAQPQLGKHLSEDGLTAYFTRCLMTIPAIEENAELLGRIKSQLELLQ